MSSPCKVSLVGTTVRGVIVGPWPSSSSTFSVEVEGETRSAHAPDVFIGCEVDVVFDPDNPEAPGKIVAAHQVRRMP